MLVISSFISGRAGKVESSGSEVFSCSHVFQYLCWNQLCVDPVSSRWCVGVDAALIMMARKIFWQLVGSRLLLRLSSISTVSVPVFLFRLMLERCCIGLISDVHLQTNEDWYTCSPTLCLFDSIELEYHDEW